jgi:pimeloyl-ACP methyl ester carboxylesterase
MRTLRDAFARSYWSEWERIGCPTLVVRAKDGGIPRAVANRMVACLDQARLVELPGSEHDVHLARADQWRAALSTFLDSLADGNRIALPGSR